MRATVLALVGTDHHPFHRLVDWVDAAAVRHPDVRFVVQHGAAAPPLVAEGHKFLSHARLTTEMTRCAAVVCHGGPGTIMDARAAGHVPLCVPRDPGLGEHVDGHQLRFARLVGAAGVVRAVHDAADFQTTLDTALLDGPGLRAVRTFEESAATIHARAALAEELDLLLDASRRHGRPGWRRRPHALR
ncbi:glycosyltransferase [Nocardioides ochotonae]|uniref:glycosyltransferase n=1 Tax=Nocardioides ochotonae TaxID=2685869 RepID=UPI001409EDE4|nr:glycosyltransferase [Nocardioides ochotonae]